jgi:DNA-binding NtrC family response regulator
MEFGMKIDLFFLVMTNGKKWAFILERDQFFRLSLKKILKKYGFEVEEIEHFSELEGRRKEIEDGMILADAEPEQLERSVSLIRRWNDRFILMTALLSPDLAERTKRLGVQHILKKPVEPKHLRKVIEKISFPDDLKTRSSGKKSEGSRLHEKGGEKR